MRTPDRDTSMRRVLIVGSSNAGKTTLGRRLARVLDVPVIELDALHWGPNWTPVPEDTFRERVEAALSSAGDGWVVDGNYEGRLGDRIWRRADTVVFLDLSLAVLLGRIVRRTIIRSITREDLYSGNRERLRYLVSPWRESLLCFTARFYRQKRGRFAARRTDDTYRHAHFVHLRSARDLERWMATLPAIRRDRTVGDGWRADRDR